MLPGGSPSGWPGNKYVCVLLSSNEHWDEDIRRARGPRFEQVIAEWTPDRWEGRPWKGTEREQAVQSDDTIRGAKFDVLEWLLCTGKMIWNDLVFVPS